MYDLTNAQLINIIDDLICSIQKKITEANCHLILINEICTTRWEKITIAWGINRKFKKSIKKNLNKESIILFLISLFIILLSRYNRFQSLISLIIPFITLVWIFYFLMFSNFTIIKLTGTTLTKVNGKGYPRLISLFLVFKWILKNLSSWNICFCFRFLRWLFCIRRSDMAAEPAIWHCWRCLASPRYS